MAPSWNSKQHSSPSCRAHHGHSTIRHYQIIPSLANTQLLSAISELNCPICLSVLRQPIQLPCDRLVCAHCLTEWIHLRGSVCPCCYNTIPLECTQLKPASIMVQLLLHDVMVSCASCKRNVKAIDYDTHTCTDEVNKEEMQLVHTIVHRMIDASKENCMTAKLPHLIKCNTLVRTYFQCSCNPIFLFNRPCYQELFCHLW